MQELQVTLKMLDVNYIIACNGIIIKLLSHEEETIMSITAYLNSHEINWTYIRGGYDIPNNELKHEHNRYISHIIVYYCNE